MSAYGLFLVSGLAVGALYALGGVGLVVLNRATGFLNFAHGAIGAMGAMTAWQMAAWAMPEPVVWGAAIGIGALLSLLFGRFVAPSLAHREPVVKAVATLGFAIALLGVMNLLWVTTPRRLSFTLDGMFITLGGIRITGTRMLAFGGGLAVVAGVTVLLVTTRVGLMMRSLADNRHVAALLGTPVLRVETLAWGLSGALAGFTGLMFGGLVQLDPTLLTFMVIPVIAAAIVARLSSISVTFAAGLLIGVTESMLALYPPLAPFRSAAPFAVAIVALMWLQRGRRLTFAGED